MICDVPTKCNINLPEKWVCKSLLDLVEKTGQRDPRKKPYSQFKYVDVSSVSNLSYRIIGWNIVQGKDAPSRARKVINAKDTIFATVRPYLKNIAQIPVDLDNEICSTGFCIIRPNEKLLDPDFLYYSVLTKSFIDNIVSQQRGSSYPAVSNKTVLESYIPLPPLSEQRAIAHVLNTVRRSIEATERVIAAARELKRSMMKYLFTYGPVPVDEAENVVLKETEVGLVPEEWEVVRLGSVIEKPQYGYTETASNQPIGPHFLRITDIRNGSVYWSAVPYCRCNSIEFDKYKLSSEDILVARIGATTGKSYIVENPPPSVFASYLIRIRSKQEILTSSFLFHYMNTNYYWTQINAIKGGRLKQGVNIPNIQNILIPIPIINDQMIVSQTLNAIDTKIKIEETEKESLQILFGSLLHNLMTGKVRVHDLEGDPPQPLPPGGTGSL